MKFPTTCPICHGDLEQPEIQWTHPSSDMLACRNPDCYPDPFFISIAASQHHIDGWGLTRIHNNKTYYLQSLEDSQWQEDDEDLTAEEIVMIPQTIIHLIQPGIGDKSVIEVPRFYPYPNSLSKADQLLNQLLNLVPFS